MCVCTACFDLVRIKQSSSLFRVLGDMTHVCSSHKTERNCALVGPLPFDFPSVASTYRNLINSRCCVSVCLSRVFNFVLLYLQQQSAPYSHTEQFAHSTRTQITCIWVVQSGRCCCCSIHYSLYVLYMGSMREPIYNNLCLCWIKLNERNSFSAFRHSYSCYLRHTSLYWYGRHVFCVWHKTMESYCNSWVLHVILYLMNAAVYPRWFRRND